MSDEISWDAPSGGSVRDVTHATTTTEDTNSQACRDQLATFSSITSALSSSNDLDFILQTILTGATASQGLGFNRAFLFLLEESDNTLIGHMAVGPSSAEEAGLIWERLQSTPRSLDELLESSDAYNTASNPITSRIKDIRVSLATESLVSKACTRHRWLNLEEINDLDTETLKFADLLGTRRLALVPMVSKGKLMGLLAADNLFTARKISDDDGQLLQALANQAAVAMERAKLYEEQEARAGELRQTYQLLRESQEQIIQIEKLSIIGELTSAIAHELRNPLAIIGGFANLLLGTRLTDEQKEYLNIIAGETKRSENVITQVVDFSRASRNDRRRLDFGRLVARNFRLVVGRNQIPESTARLNAPDIRIEVFGNEDQLSHALYQFLRLIVEEIVPLELLEVSINITDDKVAAVMRIHAQADYRDKAVQSLKRIFTDSKASQRLSILVGGETIRAHGGNFGLSVGADQVPALFVELPILKGPENVT